MQEHKRWLQFAKDDLESAKILLNSPQSIVTTSIYHAQQCAEKALKGYLIYKRKDPKFTHDLVLLLKHCLEHDAEFICLEEDTIFLTPYSSSTRYPDSCLMLPDLYVVKLAIQKAERILIFIEDKTTK